jgi:RNA polymerase sigma-70 factor (ECF subfamily)
MRKHVKCNSTELVNRPDDDLVNACKSGDVAAFEELVKRYDLKLLRIACHVIQNREDAEEAVQDAFLKAYMNLNQFEGKASFSTWLTRIVVNESLMKLRKRNGRKEHSISPTHPDESIPFDVADWAPNPEQLYSASELRVALRTSLEALSPALRVVFVLRDMAELSGDETAEVLGLGLSAVKARLFRARLQLREMLTKHFRKPAVTKGLSHLQSSRARLEQARGARESGPMQTTDNQKINGPFISKVSDGDATWNALYELLTQR